MHALAVVREIRRLLDEGDLSQRAIARRVGVSRGLVARVAAGQRSLVDRGAPSYPELFGPEAGLPVRCPGCGGMVYEPCRLCEARKRTELEATIRKLTRPTPRRPLRDPRRVA